MAEQKHTPGPWHLSEGHLMGPGGGFSFVKIASPWNEGSWNDDPETWANMQILAAAPDMLAALKALVGAPEYDGMPFGERTAMATAAIAKAERPDGQ